MIVINDKNNMCRTAVKYKQRSSGTKQLELNFLGDMASHNIYFTKLAKSSDRLHKFKQPGRTVRFNKLGCSDSLDVPVSKFKSFYKDELGTFIEVVGHSKPIAVRESLYEINNIINKEN
jgi:hypothetical protein